MLCRTFLQRYPGIYSKSSSLPCVRTGMSLILNPHIHGKLCRGSCKNQTRQKCGQPLPTQKQLCDMWKALCHRATLRHLKKWGKPPEPLLAAVKLVSEGHVLLSGPGIPSSHASTYSLNLRDMKEPEPESFSTPFSFLVKCGT